MSSTAKIAGTSILFGISFLSALLPYVMVRCLVEKLGVSSKFKRAISVLNCFSGGVFFATSVLHLLPEARESMEDVFTIRDIDTDFPLTECIMGVGFLFILFLEHVAHRCFSHAQFSTESASKTKNAKNGKLHHSEAVPSVGYHRKSGATSPRSSPSDDVIVVRDFEDSTYRDDASYLTYGTVDSQAATTTETTWPFEIDPKLPPKSPKIDRSGSQSGTTPDEEFKILAGNRSDNVETGTALQYTEQKENHRVHVLRSLILLGALSIHMIFDGLALGLLTEDSEIWNLVLALGIHKALVFFTIGLQLLELLKSIRKTIGAAFVFSLVSPLGILIGELIASGGNDVTRDTVTAVLQAFATGTFIFVTFFEILQQELNTGAHDLLKVFATVVGFALVSVIKLFTHEE